MKKSDVSHPIHVIVNGHNYIPWAQAMRSFLKGCRLWRYITGTIVQPAKKKEEVAEKFADHLEGDSKNHQINTWLCSLVSLHSQIALGLSCLPTYRYTTTYLSH